MKIIKLASKDKEQKIKITKCKNGDFIFCVSNFEEGSWHSDSVVVSKSAEINGDKNILKSILE